MEDYNGKYSGEEIDALLDKVANGSLEDTSVYVWEYTETIDIENAVSRTITQEVLDALTQAKTVVLKTTMDGAETQLVGNTKILSDGSLYIVFDMHFIDKLVQLHFNIVGTDYSLVKMENPIITDTEWSGVAEKVNKIPEIEKLINSHNKKLEFFAIEPVTVIVDGVVTECAANEVSTVFVGDKDFEIIPTSNSSIQSLLGYPIPLTWHDWLEGVDVFENIVFDMNNLDTYKHWIQYYQGDYHVQKAQYSNCIFWSDKPYTHSPFEERTNYTIYYSAELPMCYSTIPNNTYKPFYLAYGVKTDPNWNNPDYVNSYSIVSGATQTFSYYGATAIGIFDMAVDTIKLPKDCRGLMYHAPAITHAGVFDAINTTNFGAKKGSWQDAFGDCISLTSLYIMNLKTSINVSWSPINNESIEFILNNAANTSAITISVSPYTWYRLTDEIRELAKSKNITLALISTNYADDSRWVTKQDTLVSGENIKTVNGESILGSGNVQIDLSGYATTQDLEGKVDKVDGKQLSTEDFTTVLKNKLDGLNNYDDTTISQAVDKLRTDLDALVSGDTTTAIKTFNEVIAFLDGIEDSQDLEGIIASIEQQIAGKQDAISDLATIRDGASKGATALQSIPEVYVTEGQLIWNKVEGEAGVRLKGTNGTATGNLAISAGDDKTASDGTKFTSAASGDHAVAFGFGNTCAGRTTLAQGLYNTVNGKDSVAFGQRNLVDGDQAFAAGQLNEVTARLGVAIGYKNKATNTDSIAIGYQNTSGGSASVAMGDTCEANGTSSTAMGFKTKATGSYSSTFGQNTQATNSGEVAMGVYNKSTNSTDTSEQTSFSFGIGTSDTNRINALEIKKNGDVYIGDKLLSVEDFMTVEDLATVATSGNYNDLSNKPTIPSEVTESTVSGWGFTKNTGTYSKPEYGIPKTDLDQEVNDILHTVEVTDLPQLAADVASAVKQSDLYNDSDGEILPRLIVKRGLIEDTEVGFTYALPFASEESLGDADTTLATTDLAEQIARSVAFIEEEDGSSILTRAKNGLFQVEVDGELGEIFALPNLGEDLQGEADHIIATDKDIQQLDGKVYVWKPASFVLNSTFSVSGDYAGIKNSKIVILDLGTTRYISAPITIDASGNITLNFVSHTATGMQIVTALIDTNKRCTTSASSVTFPTIEEKESWSGKQEKLVSGTNIKTINNQSILGSGNISISGGGSGTITGVSANGTSIATSGVANIPAASTSAYGVTKLTTATNSTSTTLAATASAVKSAYDLANSYKGTVTAVKVNGSSKSPSSGTVDIGNVVTSVKVNGSTYNPSSGVIDLGTISGGDSSSGGGDTNVEILSGTEIFIEEMRDNSVYVCEDYVTSLEIDSYYEPIHHGSIVRFTTGNDCSISIYDDAWANGTIPTIESYTSYELSITFDHVNNLSLCILTPFKSAE